MESVQVSASRSSIRTLPLFVVGFTLATAAIHFYHGYDDPSMRLISFLNGLGYLSLVSALYLPLPVLTNRHRLFRFALMGYAALTVGVYVVYSLANNDWSEWLGPIDKVIELLLIGCLWLEDRQANS